MVIHELKILKKFAGEVWSKKKSFEVRKNDRNFKVGDFVRFNVLNDKGEIITFATDEYLYKIDYILTHDDFPEGIKEGYVVFSITEHSLVKTN